MRGIFPSWKLPKKKNDLSVVSIFVNPTQFNDPADYAKYPITIEKDISLLEAAGCDILFSAACRGNVPLRTDVEKKI
jgi:pantoate--beta-alanine ligase